MAILRDILAKFAVHVDDAPLTRLDRKINILKDRITKFATIAGTGFSAAAFATYKFVDAASDAEENLNVLRVTFKENSDAVIKWSKILGKEVGRSEFTLQKSAGAFGSFLQPMFEGSDRDFADMSRRLSALSVDLASFYNTTDEEAQMRVLSGLQGETEAIRRFGVDIGDTSLSAYNKSKGDNRNLAQLTLQEKTVLRFEKIMKDTKEKQGDAKRTADEWANSVRRLTDKFKDMSVRIGKRIMPMAKKVLALFERWLETVDFLATKTSILETALVGVAAVGLMAGAKWVKINKDLLHVIGMCTLATQHQRAVFLATARAAAVAYAPIFMLAGALALIEDTITGMKGGKSNLTDFLKITLDTNNPAELLTRSFERLGTMIEDAQVKLINFARELAGIAIPWWGKKLFDMATGVDGDAVASGGAPRETKEEKASRIARDGVRLAAKGDTTGYRKLYEQAQLGLDVGQVKHEYKRDRMAALKADPTLESTDGDYNEGLVDKQRLMTDKARKALRVKQQAEAAKKAGEVKKETPTITGPKPFVYDPRAAANQASYTNTVNVAITAPAGADEKKLSEMTKKAVKDALDEDKRKTMSAVGEEL